MIKSGFVIIFCILLSSCLKKDALEIKKLFDIDNRLNPTSVKKISDSVYILDGAQGALFKYNGGKASIVVKPQIKGRSFLQDFVIEDTLFYFANIYNQIISVNKNGKILDTLEVYKPISMVKNSNSFTIRSFDKEIREVFDHKVFERGKVLFPLNKDHEDIDLAQKLFNSKNRMYKVYDLERKEYITIEFRDSIFRESLDRVNFRGLGNYKNSFYALINIDQKIYLLKFLNFKKSIYKLDTFKSLDENYDITVSFLDNGGIYIYNFVDSSLDFIPL
ncbi:MAG: hypothetical protein CR982_09760 [Candidatus Cloacimonadota bacterium]|nr:MAG: hypothetical protein CR982_09760 [Candidatus Cloacimonadota bacterium]PIE78191.1 MAG: hypothetical protein CSA15_09075 [Candidatus Delongbacteria bacterium]